MKRTITIISYVILALLILVSAYAFIMANIDAAHGRHVLWQDETITFDGIQKIFKAKSLSDKVKMAFDGNDHRYGRILWYGAALTSYIPYKEFKDKGQIIATRLTQSIYVLAAYLLLVFGLTTRPYIRLLAFAALMLVPTTPYFATMPKPEPVIMLFLALFLVLTSRRGWEKAWIWLPLGIAFGAKISLLPFVLAMFLCSGLVFWLEHGASSLIFLTKNLLAFLLGLGISVPILFAGQFSKYLAVYHHAGQRPSDNEINDALAWIQFIITKYFHDTSLQMAIFMVLATLAVTVLVWRNFRSMPLPEFFRNDITILVMCSFSFILPTILFVQRIWPHYLHIGIVMLWITIFVALEETLDAMDEQSWITTKFAIVASCLIALLLIPQGSWANKEYKRLASRSKSKIFRDNLHDFRKLHAYFHKLSKEKGRTLKVNYDSTLFWPQATKRMIPVFWWGPLQAWDKGHDATVMGSYYFSYQKRLKGSKQGTATYKRWDSGYKMYQNHVASDGLCLSPPCYQPIDIGLKSAKLWVKVSDIN